MGAAAGLNAVTQHASDDEWRVLMTALKLAASQYEQFTTDEVWDFVEDFQGERRLMGGVIRQGVSDRLIEKMQCAHCGSDEFRNSDREAANENPKRVYRSLRFGRGATVTDITNDPTQAPGFWD